MSASTPWKLAVAGGVGIVAGVALVSVDWTLASLAAFVGLAFCWRGGIAPRRHGPVSRPRRGLCVPGSSRRRRRRHHCAGVARPHPVEPGRRGRLVSDLARHRRWDDRHHDFRRASAPAVLPRVRNHRACRRCDRHRSSWRLSSRRCGVRRAIGIARRNTRDRRSSVPLSSRTSSTPNRAHSRGGGELRPTW